MNLNSIGRRESDAKRLGLASASRSSRANAANHPPRRTDTFNWVMKLAMLLVWLMMAFGLILAIALPVYPHGGGEGSSQSERKSGTLTER